MPVAALESIIALGRVSEVTFGRPGPAVEPGVFPYNHDLYRAKPSCCIVTRCDVDAATASLWADFCVAQGPGVHADAQIPTYATRIHVRL